MLQCLIMFDRMCRLTKIENALEVMRVSEVNEKKNEKHDM